MNYKELIHSFKLTEQILWTKISLSLSLSLSLPLSLSFSLSHTHQIKLDPQYALLLLKCLLKGTIILGRTQNCSVMLMRSGTIKIHPDPRSKDS